MKIERSSPCGVGSRLAYYTLLVQGSCHAGLLAGKARLCVCVCGRACVCALRVCVLNVSVHAVRANITSVETIKVRMQKERKLHTSQVNTMSARKYNRHVRCHVGSCSADTLPCITGNRHVDHNARMKSTCAPMARGRERASIVSRCCTQKQVATLALSFPVQYVAPILKGTEVDRDNGWPAAPDKACEYVRLYAANLERTALAAFLMARGLLARDVDNWSDRHFCTEEIRGSANRGEWQNAHSTGTATRWVRTRDAQ